MTPETILRKAAIEAKKLVNEAAVRAARILEDASQNITNTRTIANDLSEIKHSFKEHVKADAIQFTEIREMIEVNTERIKTIEENTTEILDIFRTLSKGKKLLIAFALFIGSIVGIGASLKTISGWLR